MLYVLLSIIALLLAIIASALLFGPEKTRHSLRGMRGLTAKIGWLLLGLLIFIVFQVAAGYLPTTWADLLKQIAMIFIWGWLFWLVCSVIAGIRHSIKEDKKNRPLSESLHEFLDEDKALRNERADAVEKRDWRKYHEIMKAQGRTEAKYRAALAEADISDRSKDDRRTGFLVKDDNWIGFLVAAWISFLTYERFIGLPKWVYNLWEYLDRGFF